MDDPAFYFPIATGPYRFAAGLHRFGTDFGNGVADRLFFQTDREAPRYRQQKALVPPARAGVLERDETDRRIHTAILAWMQDRIATGHSRTNLHTETASGVRDRYARIAGRVQEDFVILRRTADRQEARAIAVFVGAPSGWRPETVLDASFAAIHGPVPGFAEEGSRIASMVSGMVERGPYVRFVWTITADDQLDHHPEEGHRAPWRPEGKGWLRVERQVTVPFPSVGGALFLIRTYLYPFADLETPMRTRLREALAEMPEEIALYKGLTPTVREIAHGLLLD